MGPKIEHKIVDEVECKWCSFHKKFESLDKFGKDSHSADGLRNKCKESRLGTYKRLTEDFKNNYEKHKIEDGKYFKWCKRHNEFEPLENFNICNRSFDGLMANCRTTKQLKSKIYDESIKKSKEKINKMFEDEKQKNKILEENNEIEKIKKEENNEKEKQKENGKKKCNKCEEFKDFKEFSKDSSTSMGLANLCRKCKCPGSGERIGKKARAEHIIINGVDGKECTRCKEWKSFENNNYKKTGFYKDGIRRYESHCRTCNNEIERERYNQKDNKMSKEELLKSKIETSKKLRNVKEIDGQKMKLCSNIYHNEWIPVSNFTTDGKTYVDGELKYRTNCNNCRKFSRSVNRKRIAIIKFLNKTNYINNYINNHIYTNNNKKYCEKHNKYYKQCFECFPNENLEYNKFIRERRRNNNNLRLELCIKSRIRSALKGLPICKTYDKLLGIPIEEYFDYLESKFIDGMTRDNYGPVWHVDHIIPCSKFDLSLPENQIKCFNWRNTQPLFGPDNMLKRDNYEYDEEHENLLDSIIV